MISTNTLKYQFYGKYIITERKKRIKIYINFLKLQCIYIIRADA